MERIKMVVDWIINENLYCIVNVHSDGIFGNWLSDGMEVRDKYISLWTQIAEEFKDYDEHLIFESMDKLNVYNYTYDYNTLLNLSQTFIDIVRNFLR